MMINKVCRRMFFFPRMSSFLSAFHARHCHAVLINDCECSGSSLTNEIVRKKRNEMFNNEKQRQKNMIPRIKKIRVEYKGSPEDAVVVLNKDLSTPSTVAKHLSDMLVDRSALALVNGHLWDMHRPLEENCDVELMHFHMEDPFHLNRAFWRSCSFLLGAVLETVFNARFFVELHSFPAPNVSSGSFVHDADLKIPNWVPTKEELMALSAAIHRLAEKRLPFERLVVDADLALEMFQDNKYKTNQIPSIAEKSKTGHSVTLYRVGDHIDISGGPMVADSSFVGRRCSIVAAHQIDHDGNSMHRFQGVALPKNIFLNHFAFGLLEKRASKLNLANLSISQNIELS